MPSYRWMDVDEDGKVHAFLDHCGGCGEPYPCTVLMHRSSHNADTVAAHIVIAAGGPAVCGAVRKNMQKLPDPSLAPLGPARCMPCVLAVVRAVGTQVDAETAAERLAMPRRHFTWADLKAWAALQPDLTDDTPVVVWSEDGLRRGSPEVKHAWVDQVPDGDYAMVPVVPSDPGIKILLIDDASPPLTLLGNIGDPEPRG